MRLVTFVVARVKNQHPKTAAAAAAAIKIDSHPVE
jgi:hypothetical protein